MVLQSTAVITNGNKLLAMRLAIKGGVDAAEQALEDAGNSGIDVYSKWFIIDHWTFIHSS